MKKNLFTLSLFLLASVIFAADYALEIATDFKDASSLKGSLGTFADQAKLHFVDIPSGKALEAKRTRDRYRITFIRPLKKDEDFGYSFDITRLTNNSSICTGVSNKAGKYSAMLHLSDNGYVYVMDNKLQRYRRTGLYLKPGIKYHLSVTWCANSKTITVNIPGQPKYSQSMPSVDNLNSLVLNPQRPDNGVVLIENLHVYAKPGRIVCKENGAAGSPVESAGIVSGKLTKITDGNYTDAAELNENSVIEFPLPKRINITAVQIYGGNLFNRQYPSSACSPRAYLVEGYSNGAWLPLVKEENAPDPCVINNLKPEDRFTRHNFNLATVDRIRITFSKSHDTGKRVNNTTVKDRKVYIREVEFLTDREIALRAQLTSLIATDFHLPVYRNASKANLTLIADSSPATPLKGTITITSPEGKVVRTMDVSWKHGSNNIVIDDIGNFAPGRYMMTLRTDIGKISRLLRIEKSPEIAAPEAPLKMTGKKLFFTPDKFTFKEIDDLSVVIGETEVFKHTQTPSSDKLSLSGTAMYKTKDGKYAISVIDRPYKISYGKGVPRHLVSDSILGPFTEVAKLPPRGKDFSPLKPFYENKFHRTVISEKLELYDPAKHGKIKLTDLSYHCSYEEKDLGCLIAPPRHYYVIGRTKDGKKVVMNKNFIFHDFNYFGEDDFDNGFTTNDNFGGMWLSPDGKECFWAQGQTVKRSAPYNIEYDNLSTSVRLLTVYSSTDGVNWKLRNVMSIPDEKDSLSEQHYGVHVLQLAHGDLFLAEMFNYDAVAQQIYIELIYSRDGINFHRFKDRTPFARGKDPDSWYYGHIFTNTNYIKEGKYYYQQAHYCTPNPHFYWEVISNIPNNAAASGNIFRTRFQERNIKNWPFFDKVGGFEGMAEYTRKGFYASGVIRFRADGWFGVQAADKEGSFATNLINAKGKVTANARINENGFIKFQLCNADGKVIEEKNITGDDLEIKVFGNLPENDFFIKAVMKNATLYTLNFN